MERLYPSFILISMNVIKRIEIRNFRSIHHLKVENDLQSINTFIGKNDIGKSNILRALNLFFNGETEIGKKLNFWEDFNKTLERKSGKGQYIKITLDIDLKYEVGKFVRWTKHWDNEGQLTDTKEVFTNTGQKSDFLENSRAKGWLNRIKFRYIPANKSPQYFQHLFEELHDILSTTYSSQFTANTKSLIDTIQEITKEITKELLGAISIENKISIPSNLRSFFGTLDFSTEFNDQKFNLSERGDGIKVRHIPIILKFLADKAKVNKKGALEIQTIWGFEEPENNLEMSHAFEMAEEFLGYSISIQMFISTHSPAFYSLHNKSNKASCFLVERNDTNSTSVINAKSEGIDVDEKMGVLAYITPFIESKNEELKKEKEKTEKLLEQIQGLEKDIKVLVFTEDSANELLMIKAVLESNGFDLTQTAFLSYEGKDNLKSAIFSCKILIKEKFKSVQQVVFHRDNDIDGDEILTELSSKLPKNYHLFITKGYDLDSHFLDKNHIVNLYPELCNLDIDQMIQESIAETKDKSLDKITDGLFQAKHKKGKLTVKDSPKKLTEAATLLFNSNNFRYSYGKKALGRLIGKLQHKPKDKEFNLYKKSEALVIDELKELASKIWLN